MSEQLPDVAETGQPSDGRITVRNGISNAVASALVALASLAGSVIIVRSLDSGQYGALSYFLWLVSIFSTAGTLAFPRAVTKLVSELLGQRRDGEAADLLRWVGRRVALLNLMLSLALVLIATQAGPQERPYLLLVALVLAPYALMAVVRSTLWGHERYPPAAIADIVTAGLQLTFIVAAAALGWGVLGFLAAAAAAYLLGAAGMAIAARRTLGDRFSRRARGVTSVAVRPAFLALLIPASLVVVYEAIVWQRSEIFFLEHWAGLEQVGYYNLAFTVFGTLLLVGWALLHAFYPAISRTHGGGDWEGVRRLVHDGSILAAVFAVPLTFGGWAVIENLTMLLYTDRMLPIVPVAQVLLLGLLPGSLAFLLGVTAMAVGGIWLQVRVGLAVAVLNLVLDVALIQPFGAMGAAAASTTAQCVYGLGMWAVIRRQYGVTMAWAPIGRLIVVGAVATFIVPSGVQVLVPGAAGLVVAIFLGAATYVAGMWLAGYGRWLMPGLGPVFRSLSRGRIR